MIQVKLRARTATSERNNARTSSFMIITLGKKHVLLLVIKESSCISHVSMGIQTVIPAYTMKSLPYEARKGFDALNANAC